jgi:hypothetical protein
MNWICCFFYSLLIILAGCQADNKTAEQVQESSDIKVTVEEKLLLNEKSTFDLARFRRLSDSLLSAITGDPIQLTCTLDTLQQNSPSLFDALLPSSSFVCVYSFHPGRKNSILRLTITRAYYPDTAAANKTFRTLLDLGSDQHDEIPGLTYTNDHVLKTAHEIYWLNTGCSYADFNHRKIKEFMLSSLSIENIEDSIMCVCGGNCEPQALSAH